MSKKVRNPQTLSRAGRVALRDTLRDLQAISNEVNGWSVETWAGKSGVVPTTIYNLIHGKTRFPRFETIRKMAKSIGVEIVLDSSSSKVSILLPDMKGKKRGRKAA